MIPEQYLNLSTPDRLSNLGTPSVDNTQTPPVDNNPINTILTQFQTQRGNIQTFMDSYPGAEEEAREVNIALTNWLNKIVEKVNQGQNTNQNIGY
jgi:hypothetical protein